MTLFDIRVTTTVNRRVVGSSPTGGAKRAGRHQSSCSFSLYLLTQTVDPATHSHTAVNWLGAPRYLRQMKRCYEQEETTSIATRSSSSVAPYHSLSPLAKTHSLRTSSSPPNARILGHPPSKATMFLTICVVGSSPKRLSDT